MTFILLDETAGGKVVSRQPQGTATQEQPLRDLIFDNAAGAAPLTSVVLITYDVAGDLSPIRHNHTPGANGAGDKGAKNFGNSAAYVGMRWYQVALNRVILLWLSARRRIGRGVLKLDAELSRL